MDSFSRCRRKHITSRGYSPYPCWARTQHTSHQPRDLFVFFQFFISMYWQYMIITEVIDAVKIVHSIFPKFKGQWIQRLWKLYYCYTRLAISKENLFFFKPIVSWDLETSVKVIWIVSWDLETSVKVIWMFLYKITFLSQYPNTQLSGAGLKTTKNIQRWCYS